MKFSSVSCVKSDLQNEQASEENKQTKPLLINSVASERMHFLLGT